MSLDRHTRCGEEIDGLPRAFASGYLASEHPIPSADRLKVFLFHPAFGLLGMSPLRPLPQSPKDRVVHFRQGLLAAHMPVIVGPAPDDRVELHNQVSGSGLTARLDDGSDFGQERRHILAGWLDQDGAVVSTHVLSEEIKAVLNMRDTGLLR